MASQAKEPAPRPKGLKLLAAALANRKSACMLAFGVSSGLPFALLVGTLTAWMGEVGIKLATIGVFSWIGLSYSFQFLWSPLVDRLRLPGLERLGRRKSWILLCQALVIGAIVGLAATDPAADIGRFVLIAFVGAVASATQDIALNGWRIDVADEETPISVLTALYQFGYRSASIIGGAIALVLASSMSWPQVYLVMAGLMGLLVTAVFAAPDTPRPPPAALEGALAEPGALKPKWRALLLFAVGASWLWAIGAIVSFMISMLADTPPGVEKPSVTEFSLTYGPLILLATVFLPLGAAALANWLKKKPEAVLAEHDNTTGGARGLANHLYSALVDTLSDLCERLGWGVLIILGFILTYAICYNIWASFAYPFYLGELKYTKEEVAFASKVFGIVMTMLGISLGGYLYERIGRFPTVLLGAILPPLGNFLYADLADGGRGIDAFSHFLRLDALAQMFGTDERMVRLMLAICYENISTGMALTAFVAYVSSIVSKKYAAIQYALLSSLVSLVGTLGRGAVGRAFDQYGYAPVFRWTAATAIVAVVFVTLEWVRTSRIERAAKAAEASQAAD